MSLRELVEDIRSGVDSSNPYADLKDDLVSIKTKASAIVFTDANPANTSTSPPEPPTAVTLAIEAFEAYVVTFNSSIDSITSSMNNHYNNWWRSITGYKTIPSVLLSADNQEKRMLESDGEEPKADEDKFFYKGSQTWSSIAGNLASWENTTQQNITTIDTIQGGVQTDTVDILAATTILENILTSSQSIESSFDSLALEETYAWDNAIEFFNAYAYATFITDNRDSNPLVEDLVNKFSDGINT